MFVDDSGVVRATEIQRSAGLDHDFPAVAIARKLRFRPATLTGRPVPAWVLLPITTAAQPESCPSMAVPLSAGVATFVDSTVLERPELGTLYRFEGVGELRQDVFIYPSAAWGPPEEQAKAFLEATEIQRQRGRFLSFELIEEKPRNIEAKGRGRTVNFRGHTVRVLVVGTAGQTRESYFAVYPHADRWVKFRVSYSPSAEARKLIDEFERQLLSALANNPPQCPL
jgi:hypothetical protein